MANPKKTTNRLRLVLCGLYIFQMILLTEPLFNLNNGENFSCFKLIYVSVSSALSPATMPLIIISVIIALIPIVGFFMFAFDKSRNIKNLYGILSTLLAYILLLGGVSGSLYQENDGLVMTLGSGMALMLITYMLIVFLSVMSMFARNIQNSQHNQKD